MSLRPVLALGLGMAGFTVGLNLDLRVLRRLPLAVYASAAAQSAGALATGVTEIDVNIALP